MTVRLAMALVLVSAVAMPRGAEAFRPTGSPDQSAHRVLAGDGPKLRDHRDVSYGAAPPAMRESWQRLQADSGGAWRASWDTATKVPSRIFGAGVSAPGAVESAQAAERAARRFLTEHIDLLAPGSDPADFEVVSNRLDDDLRSVGLAQYHAGLRVVGGQVSFRFRNDRLVVIGSEALPHVRVDEAGPPLSAEHSRRAAARSSGSERGAAERAGEVDGPVVLPLVGERGVHGYRIAQRVDVTGARPGQRWDVYVDAHSGDVLARHARTLPGTATVQFDTPVRHPRGERRAYSARNASALIGDDSNETDDDGSLSWNGPDDVFVTLRPRGSSVDLGNITGGVASYSTSVGSDSTLTWDAGDHETVDAQLTAFVHTQLAADRARQLTADASWIDESVEVNVNIDADCNAFFDQTRNSLNFFTAGEECANTARLPDVIYHEYGHLLHVESIIDGVGQFDGAMSEGAADYFAAIITGDPGVGRGFFYDDEALRHIFPDDGSPRTWPDDIAGIHATGLIFAGAMWRLREKLIDEHGEDEGTQIADELFYAALQRGSDIPSTYIEVLVADDDDGDLTAGTPNICKINSAFGAHGLRTIRGEIDDLATPGVSRDGHEVGFRVYGIYDGCESDRIESAELLWKERGDDGWQRQPVEQRADDSDAYGGVIPAQQRDTTIRYRFEVTFADGATLNLPQNPGDPALEFYVGDVVPLYCTDFEEAPFGQGWARGAHEGSNDWEWGPPAGQGDDPPFAFAGDNVLGTNLGDDEGDSTYSPSSANYLRSPEIDVGDFTNVRLHYRRWLNVRDGFFDRATILANDEVVWQNKNSNEGVESSAHHRDSMWSFHDVPLEPVMDSDTVRVSFELHSNRDGGLGGWNIDDFCVVADPDAVCGDGVAAGFAACDDGDENSDVLPDACRTNCQLPHCGDGVVNTGEECDPSADDDRPCTAECRLVETDSGCAGCGAGAGAGGVAGPLVTLLLAYLARAKRPARARRRKE